MPHNPNEEKLPKWAQRELRRLRVDLAYAHDRLSAGPDSLVTANPFSDAPTHLENDANVEFGLPNGYVRVKIMGDTVEVHGSDLLSIEPRASNVVSLRIIPRWPRRSDEDRTPGA